MTTPQGQSPPPFIDPSKASAIPCLVVDDHQVLATLALGHLLQLVPDPMQFEDKRAQHSLFTNPALVDLAEKRETIQRYFNGAKKSNLPKYADFIAERVQKSKHRGTPPICLGTTSKLTVVPNPSDGTARVAIPYSRYFLAVDGETQRAAWQLVTNKVWELSRAGLIEEEILENVRVPVEIHHGLTVDDLQALFYERNVLGAKVNVNEAIAKDQRDPATQIVRAVMAMAIQHPSGQRTPTSAVVMQQSRQVGKNAPEWITLSALRTLVVTTLYGRAGLQYGAKPVPMPDNVDFESLKAEVANVAHLVLQTFAAQFANRDKFLIGSPAILAGIGVAANRTLGSMKPASDKPRLTVKQLLDMLSEIRWERDGFWDGIGTRKTPKGVTTVAGPKEVGYAVSDAIDGTNPVSAAQIRGRPSPPPAQEPMLMGELQ
ncbi:DNA sulfur modification protein DndB [Micromonospora sp. C28SCA-DRY-2]|uniref:DNA sulfur modification protein DndB n=1 Tax=Micromonospora sp. C28SCA-DRY-2 TaxID=3059522 RepID=UPI002675C38E|nr:DNA sulfur modification protein DndB [Micromonospora sp. C28SCA-DRY-2]MDO3702707.1 DNA sulfur modification protein DndB [Micromonospora sp. C28SCA-DRY-2]